jgi:hypothetical protein
MPMSSSALQRQEGEAKYSTPYRGYIIQPVEFIQQNRLSWCEGNVIKYVCRHKMKNGKEDLMKAKHYIELLIEMEYPDKEYDENQQTDRREVHVPDDGTSCQPPETGSGLQYRREDGIADTLVSDDSMRRLGGSIIPYFTKSPPTTSIR